MTMRESSTLPDPAAHVVGCPECDLLVHVRLPEPGRSVRCPRCRFSLASGVADPFARPLAFAMAALVLMLVALLFPFLEVSAAGLENTMTLAQAMTSMSRFGAETIAVLVTAFVLFVPGAMMAAVVVLYAALAANRSYDWLVPLARALFYMDAWCMADVFAIGVIVSLVKLSTMADVVLGTAFWAFLGFSVCFLITVTAMDRLTVWTAIDRLQRQS